MTLSSLERAVVVRRTRGLDIGDHHHHHLDSLARSLQPITTFLPLLKPHFPPHTSTPPHTPTNTTNSNSNAFYRDTHNTQQSSLKRRREQPSLATSRLIGPPSIQSEREGAQTPSSVAPSQSHSSFTHHGVYVSVSRPLRRCTGGYISDTFTRPPQGDYRVGLVRPPKDMRPQTEVSFLGKTME